jgi:DNA-binding NarL/FixJ family response regulator
VTVQQIRTPPVPRARSAALRNGGAQLVSQPRREDSPLCLVIPEIADGEAAALVRSLRRRDSTRAVLLTRKAGRRELIVLLCGGVRGAITSEPPRAVRATRSAGTPAGTPALSAREVGVLRLVAEGRSNRDIGEHLSLSALTVKSHLARISRKIGTGDRAEMVAFAIRHDLLR